MLPLGLGTSLLQPDIERTSRNYRGRPDTHTGPRPELFREADPCAFVFGLALQTLTGSDLAQRRPMSSCRGTPTITGHPTFVRGRFGFVLT